MNYRYFSFSTFLIISGCTGLGVSALNAISVDLHVMANEVNCELRDAVADFLADAETPEERSKRDAWISDFTAQYELTLDNWQTAGANISSLNWSIPNFPNPITIGNTTEHSRRGENKYFTKFSTINDLKSVDCNASISTKSSALRIDKAINDAWRTHTMNGAITPTSYSYQKSFNIIYDATISPGFSIVNFDATTKFQGRNRSFNTFDIDFNKKPKKSDPLVVSIQAEEGIPVLVLNSENQSIPVYTPVESDQADQTQKESDAQLAPLFRTPKKPKENWQTDLLDAVKDRQKAYKEGAIQNRIEEQHNNNLRTLNENGEFIER